MNRRIYNLENSEDLFFVHYLSKLNDVQPIWSANSSDTLSLQENNTDIYFKSDLGQLEKSEEINEIQEMKEKVIELEQKIF